MSDVTSVAQLARRKFQWRVLAPLVLLIVLSSLDRVNISFAALQMNAQLGLSPEGYGRAVGAFWIGYLLFQFPSTWLLTRIGARRWITLCVLTWGTVATCMAFSSSALELYLWRFLLGVAESGFAPGVVYYISTWMPARHRANTIAVTMLAIPISVVVGGPLCGWLMSVTNPLDMVGWRFMMMVEGLVTVALGGAAYFIFVDRPAAARWLDERERAWIARELDAENRAKTMTSNRPMTLAHSLTQPALWLAASVWSTTLIGANGLMFWLPQVVQESSTHSDLAIGVLSAIPWLGVGLGMLVNSWHSDKTQERFVHVGGALLVAALGLYAASVIEVGIVALVLLFIGGVGLGSAQGVFWAIPTQMLSPEAAARGITFINLVGNLGSLLGPYLIGVIRERSESFAAPIWFVVSVLLAGVALLAVLHGRRSFA